MGDFDIVKKFIQDWKRSSTPHELKKRAFARSRSELRRFKNEIALARRRQVEKRIKKGVEKRARKMREFIF